MTWKREAEKPSHVVIIAWRAYKDTRDVTGSISNARAEKRIFVFMAYFKKRKVTGI